MTWGAVMKQSNFEAMHLDDLWKLHETVMTISSSRFETQKRELERQLDELGRTFGESADDIPQRRPYPRVMPKFQNPVGNMVGRGRQPRWVSELIEAGKTIEDFRISASKADDVPAIFVLNER
jgi:DNA-binding protein H-NS